MTALLQTLSQLVASRLVSADEIVTYYDNGVDLDDLEALLRRQSGSDDDAVSAEAQESLALLLAARARWRD